MARTDDTAGTTTTERLTARAALVRAARALDHDQPDKAALWLLIADRLREWGD